MLVLIGFIPSRAEQQPKPSAHFTRMEVAFHTDGEDKDSDTRLEVFIVEFDGAQPVAYLDVGSNTGFANDSTSPLYTVPSFGAGFTFGQLKREKLSFKINPNHHDTWRFGFDAKLYFDDGTTVLFHQDPSAQVLSQDVRQDFFNLSDAKIVPPSRSTTGTRTKTR
jgi:hypothetical protein